ncbi:MAG: N-acetyltransferase family protein [Methanoregula sp.]|nr:N-acetyltransferase family protein [Methanoregula sp.]
MHIREMDERDGEAVMRIFNHYAATGFAAYPEGPVPVQFFPHLKEGAVSAIVLEKGNGIAGFGLLKPFFPFPAFKKTGMLTYFIAPEYTGKGYGTQIFDRMVEDARKTGITVLLANISSKNAGSIRFHEKHGFVRAGTLAGVGEKFGETFDVVWMQRRI